MDPGKRSKSTLRIRYEAEVEVLRRKIGDLETIRERLGLSQRKMSQLLLVDPSAWTRWTKQNENPPPHIYRMLQWYLALQDKYPALDVNFWLHTVARETKLETSAVSQTAKDLEQIKERVERLVGEFSSHAVITDEKFEELAARRSGPEPYPKLDPALEGGAHHTVRHAKPVRIMVSSALAGAAITALVLWLCERLFAHL